MGKVMAPGLSAAIQATDGAANLVMRPTDEANPEEKRDKMGRNQVFMAWLLNLNRAVSEAITP